MNRFNLLELDKVSVFRAGFLYSWHCEFKIVINKGTGLSPRFNQLEDAGGEVCHFFNS